MGKNIYYVMNYNNTGTAKNPTVYKMVNSSFLRPLFASFIYLVPISTDLFRNHYAFIVIIAGHDRRQGSSNRGRVMEKQK